MSFQTHTVRFNGRRTRILCYGSDSTNPCSPLVAVCNFFFLKDPASMKLGEEEWISQDDLLDKFDHLILRAIKDYQKLFPEKYEKDSITIDGMCEKMPKILLEKTDLLPVQIEGTRNFKNSLHASCCHFLKVPLCHAWWVNPKEADGYQAVKNAASNELLPHVTQKFINESPLQITSYGIGKLTQALKEGELATLFRKEHLNIIYKHKDTVYVLENDKGRLTAGATWKSLNVVEEDEVYFTNEFVPLPAEQQPNKHGKRWVQDWNQSLEDKANRMWKELEIESSNASNEVKTSKKKTKKKKKNKKKGDRESDNDESKNDELAIQASPADHTLVPVNEETKETWVERLFMKFLEKVTQYEELVEAGERFLGKFHQELEYFRRPKLPMESGAISELVKSNYTDRMKSYLEASCHLQHPSIHNINQLYSCEEKLVDHINKANVLLEELQCLVEDVYSTTLTASFSVLSASDDFHSDDNLKDDCCEDKQQPGDQLDSAVSYSSVMILVHNMLKLDYTMQEKIVKTLCLKTSSSELEAYCLMWNLRPYIDDNVMQLAWKFVS